MKTHLLFALSCIAALVSCSSPKDKPGGEINTLEVSTNTLNFEQTADSKAFKITSNANWTIAAPDWCTLSRTSGNGDMEITVTPSVNTGMDKREGKITVTVNMVTPKEIAVVQLGEKKDILLDKSTEYMSSAAGSSEVTVTTNVEITAAVSGGDWLSVDDPSTKAMVDKNFGYTVKENTKVGLQRLSTITFTSTADATLSKTYNVVQFPSEIPMMDIVASNGDKPAAILPAAGGSYGVTTESRVSEVTIPEPAKWITYVNPDEIAQNEQSSPSFPNVLHSKSATKASVSGSVIFMLEANESGASRSAEVIIAEQSGRKDTIVFKQIVAATDDDSPMIQVFADSINAKAAGGTIYADIITNIKASEFESVVDPDWCYMNTDNLKEVDGYMVGRLEFTASNNYTTVSRSYTYEIKAKGSATVLAKVKIQQQGMSAESNLDYKTLRVSSAGGLVYSKYSYNGEYSVNIVGSWLTQVTPTKAMREYAFSAEPNTLYTERTALVVFDLKGKKDTLTVIQSAYSADEGSYATDQAALRAIFAALPDYRVVWQENESMEDLAAKYPNQFELTTIGGQKRLTRLAYYYVWSANSTIVQAAALPAEIGNFSQLTDLYLEGLINGTLPPEIGKLKNLRTLSLQRTVFSGLPKEIGNLISLVKFDCTQNQFYGNYGFDDETAGFTLLPDEIGNLTNLETLILQFHKFTSLPDGLYRLNALRRLSLNMNVPIGSNFISSSIANLTSLETLAISNIVNPVDCKVVLPSATWSLPNLRELSITAQGASAVSGMENSRLSSIYINGIDNSAAQLGVPSTLKSLDIEGSYADLPVMPAGLTSLTSTSKTFKSLKAAHMPLSLQNLQILTNIYGYIEDVGVVTDVDRTALSRLQNLTNLSIEATPTASLPMDAIVKLRSLQQLYLGGFEGTMNFDALLANPNLMRLRISTNELYPSNIGGEISENTWIQLMNRFPQNWSVSLAGCRFTGTIPRAVSQSDWWQQQGAESCLQQQSGYGFTVQ